jgi:anti-sigma regulatory factor (Ser/Thr protein kinase)
MTEARDTVAEHRFAARSSVLRDIRATVREAASRHGAKEACADDIVLAVDEACQNVIRHVYAEEDGDIVIRFERQGADLVIFVIDFGEPIDPATVSGRSLDDLRPGGLGTHFIQETMDEVEFVEAPPGCGNMLKLVRRLG